MCPSNVGTSLSYFPTLLKDELLYSAVARYKRQVAHIDGEKTKRRLFGTSTLPATLPGNLTHFLGHLPRGAISTEEIIERHTIFPYFAPFIGAAAVARTLSAMRERDGLAVKVSLGIARSGIKPDYYLRFCLDCAHEQHRSTTPAYWNRAHQLPGVWRCPLHASPLIDRCANCGPFDYRQAAMPLPGIKCDKCGHQHARPAETLSSSARTAEKRFADLSSELLTSGLRVAEPSVLTGGYARAIAAVRLKAKGPALAGKAFIDPRVQAYWGPELLERLGMSSGNRFSLRVPIVPDVNTSYHPVHHLLLIGFLFRSIDELAIHVGSATQ